MDTSKKYIKMCEKTIEIQEQSMEQYGDWVYCKHCNDIHVIAIHFKYKSKERFWLPRQDQLQRMIKSKIFSNSGRFTLSQQLAQVISIFAGSCPRIGEPTEIFLEEQKKYTKQFTSMEQLWLAFVMKEKYNKTWNGENWTND